MEFIHQYEVGEVDYTRERKKILEGFTLEQLAAENRKVASRRRR